MSEEETYTKPRTSLTKVLAITVLPLLTCICLAWLLSKFSGISFGFLTLVFCGIGSLVFLKEAPIPMPSSAPQKRRPKRRMTKEEIEAARAKRFYIGQDDSASNNADQKRSPQKLRDVTQPTNIIDASSLSNKTNGVPIEQTPDGSEEKTTSPERQEKKLNPERDLALKNDDF